MSWGHGIIIAFICFGVLIFSMVAISMNQNVNLVADNYYEQEINFQSQIDKIGNFNNLKEKPLLTFAREEDKCFLSFPEGMPEVEGTIHFFRQSDNNLDVIYKIQDKAIEVDISALKKGLWTVKVDWAAGEKGYYFEDYFTK